MVLIGIEHRQYRMLGMHFYAWSAFVEQAAIPTRDCCGRCSEAARRGMAIGALREQQALVRMHLYAWRHSCPALDLANAAVVAWAFLVGRAVAARLCNSAAARATAAAALAELAPWADPEELLARPGALRLAASLRRGDVLAAARAFALWHVWTLLWLPGGNGPAPSTGGEKAGASEEAPGAAASGCDPPLHPPPARQQVPAPRRQQAMPQQPSPLSSPSPARTRSRVGSWLQVHSSAMAGTPSTSASSSDLHSRTSLPCSAAERSALEREVTACSWLHEEAAALRAESRALADRHRRLCEGVHRLAVKLRQRLRLAAQASSAGYPPLDEAASLGRWFLQAISELASQSSPAEDGGMSRRAGTCVSPRTHTGSGRSFGRGQLQQQTAR